jgi:hypothetical protein
MLQVCDCSRRTSEERLGRRCEHRLLDGVHFSVGQAAQRRVNTSDPQPPALEPTIADDSTDLNVSQVGRKPVDTCLRRGPERVTTATRTPRARNSRTSQRPMTPPPPSTRALRSVRPLPASPALLQDVGISAGAIAPSAIFGTCSLRRPIGAVSAASLHGEEPVAGLRKVAALAANRGWRRRARCEIEPQEPFAFSVRIRPGADALGRMP